MKVFLAMMSHETNTFSNIRTDCGQFEARNLHYGGEIVETFRGTGTCLGDLIQAVRAVVGPAVPIAVTLDFHGNLSEEMVRGADLLHGYKSYPHLDMAERGVEATERLL